MLKEADLPPTTGRCGLETERLWRRRRRRHRRRRDGWQLRRRESSAGALNFHTVEFNFTRSSGHHDATTVRGRIRPGMGQDRMGLSLELDGEDVLRRYTYIAYVRTNLHTCSISKEFHQNGNRSGKRVGKCLVYLPLPHAFRSFEITC